MVAPSSLIWIDQPSLVVDVPERPTLGSRYAEGDCAVAASDSGPLPDELLLAFYLGPNLNLNSPSEQAGLLSRSVQSCGDKAVSSGVCEINADTIIEIVQVNSAYSTTARWL